MVSLSGWADGRSVDTLAGAMRVSHSRAVEQLDSSQTHDLERLLGTLLETTTVDVHAAMETCRLCDAHTCGTTTATVR